MQQKKLVIVGNSVGIRIRPHLRQESRNYGQRLVQLLNEQADRDTLWVVENLSFPRATLYDIQDHLPAIVAAQGDIYLLNLGVCDAATREIPRWMSDLILRPRKDWRSRLLGQWHERVVKPNRSFFVKLRGKSSWMTEQRFTREYRKLIRLIHGNTPGHLICLSILPANERVERELPGSAARYQKFNMIIAQLAQEEAAHFYELTDYEPEADYPDGTHLNDQGHLRLAQELLPICLQF
ncbi:MAG: SGNH/GDSL hydrolase family protein [Bacteroidota bacterium]